MENVLYYFKEICKIPRETYHVEKIANYLIEFAKENNLEYHTDNYHNVIIIKEAAKGYEKVPSIILQAHIDMVCQKKEDVKHDFRTDPIEVIEENGFLTANNTTLGADDGIGMAMILSILSSKEKHGKIEALFTADEEVGMDGAMNLNTEYLHSNYLINLDSEDEGILTAGCAGGVRLEVTLPIERYEKVGKTLTITISNLKGGHSGVDINKQRVNAITFIGKILNNEECDLIEINGGKVDNAIPDNISIKVLVNNNYNSDKLLSIIKESLLKNNELSANTKLIEENNTKVKVIFNSKDYLNYLSNIPNGVISYEENLDNMVKTSTNLGTIKTTNNKLLIKHLLRSSNNNEQINLVKRITKEVLLKGEVIESSNYPGWQYDNNSKLRKLFENFFI